MSARSWLIASAVLAAVVAVVAIAFFRCADPDVPAQPAPATSIEFAPPSSSAPVPETTPRSTAGSAAAEDTLQQAFTVAYTWRPGQGDVTPNDAFVRARRWFTAALAQNYSVDARTERWPNAEWAEWAEAGTTVIADVRVDCSGCPPDTDSAVHRAITIRQSAVTGDRVTAVEPELVVWATVIHQDGQWLVDRISY